jgi:Cof subfamily protein (haloacid dehalogenase superfamily)
MNYRLIALDLDGTLLDDTLQIRRQTIDALQDARDRGVQAMIVTGRHHTAAHAYWRQLDLELPAICCNGGYVYDFPAGKALAGDPFTRLEARQLLDIIRAHPIDAMIYTDEAMTYEKDAPHLAGMRRWSATLPEPLRPRLERAASLDRVIDEAAILWKFLVASEIPAPLEAFMQAASARGFDCVRSSRNRVDIAHPGNSKGRRLAEFIAQRNILPREVIAFGDQDNDKEMLQLAGLGVAMGNSRPEVRACADWVTGANDSDGIAEVLRRFVLHHQSPQVPSL